MIDRLKEDHTALQREIEALRAAFSQGAERVAVRMQCVALARRLRDHILREGRLVVSCSMALETFGAEELARFAVEHYHDREYLRVIRRFLSKDVRFSPDGIRPALNGLVSGFRHSAAQQEQELFPFLERVLALGPDAVAARRTPLVLRDGMTARPATS